jgi:hypothetical protein
MEEERPETPMPPLEREDERELLPVRELVPYTQRPLLEVADSQDYEGARVLDRGGEVPVPTLDFISLYPSIMMMLRPVDESRAEEDRRTLGHTLTGAPSQ